MTALMIIKNENAQSMVEYGILVALLSVAVIFTLLLMGQDLRGLFQSTDDSLQNVQMGLPVVP